MIVSLAAITVLTGCETVQSWWGTDGPKASASLQPTRGNNVTGTVDFVQRSDKVRVTAKVSGLRPTAAATPA